MAAPAVPYVRRAYDSQPHASRLSEMLRWRGDQQARAAERQGEISANLWGNIGNIIGQAGQTIARERVERPQREHERVVREEQARQIGQRRSLDELNTTIATLPLEQQVSALRAAGFGEEATKREREADESLTRGLQRQRAQYEVAGQRLDTARTIFETIQTAPEAERPALYRAQASGVRELVGPELGKHIRDEYDPQFMETAITWGMTATEKLAARREGIAALERESKTAEERDKNATEALIRYLPTVESQEELDQARLVAKARGAKDDTLATFPTEFTPEAVARVGERGLTAEQRARRAEGPTPGSLEAYYVTYAREHKQPPGTLSTRQQQIARAEFEASGRAPKDDPASGPTLSQRAMASRTKENELQQAEDQFRRDTRPYTHPEAPGYPGQFLPAVAIPRDLIDSHEARKRRIQASYLEQIGDTSTGARPAPAPVQPPAPAVRAAVPAPPVVPPPAAPAAPVGPTSAAAAPASGGPAAADRIGLQMDTLAERIRSAPAAQQEALKAQYRALQQQYIAAGGK